MFKFYVLVAIILHIILVLNCLKLFFYLFNQTPELCFINVLSLLLLRCLLLLLSDLSSLLNLILVILIRVLIVLLSSTLPHLVLILVVRPWTFIIWLILIKMLISKRHFITLQALKWILLVAIVQIQCGYLRLWILMNLVPMWRVIVVHLILFTIYSKFEKC